MKTPPLLLGAALIFWGWQTELLAVGVALALVLEASQLFKSRWEFSDEEIRRIWIFSSLVFIAALFYAFNANEGPSDFSRMFQDPNFSTQTRAGTAGARTVISMIRWSPMVFFLFMLAQTYSTRLEIPLATVSIFLWRRRKRAMKMGVSLIDEKSFNFSYIYFGTCLLAAGIHTNDVPGYFWGFCALLTWALWSRRSRRLNPVTWAAIVAVVIALGLVGQNGLNRLQQFITNSGTQWLAQFFQQGTNPSKTGTAIGYIGQLNASGKIVIRLQTRPGTSPPMYLREASYRFFDRREWLNNNQKSRMDLGFEPVNEDKTNLMVYVLIPDKTNTAEVNIACYLPGGTALLPLPPGSGRLEHLRAYAVDKSPEGAVRANGPGLVIFDAHYGPGATIDAPISMKEDFQVPTNEMRALNAVIEELQTNGLSVKQKLQQVQALFQNNFTYSLWQESYNRRTNNDTALTRFLLRTRSGHCEYFATATVLLLRQMNIPARYAVGYIVHESKGNKYYVRQRDGHAWCLVWDEKARVWRDFDTTPSSRIAEEAKRASPFEWLSDAWSRVRFEIARFRWGQSDVREYILWALIPILILLLYQIIFRRSWRRRARGHGTASDRVDWPGLDSEFYQLERRLAEFIGPRGANEALGDWLGRAAKDPALSEITVSLRQLLGLHYRYRFDPLGLSVADRQSLKQAVRECLPRLTKTEAPVR